MSSMRMLVQGIAALAAVSLMSPFGAQAQPSKPNILVIFGDDIGVTNVSTYALGLTGRDRTRPNHRIPRLA